MQSRLLWPRNSVSLPPLRNRRRTVRLERSSGWSCVVHKRSSHFTISKWFWRNLSTTKFLVAGTFRKIAQFTSIAHVLCRPDCVFDRRLYFKNIISTLLPRSLVVFKCQLCPLSLCNVVSLCVMKLCSTRSISNQVHWLAQVLCRRIRRPGRTGVHSLWFVVFPKSAQPLATFHHSPGHSSSTSRFSIAFSLTRHLLLSILSPPAILPFVRLILSFWFQSNELLVHTLSLFAHSFVRRSALRQRQPNERSKFTSKLSFMLFYAPFFLFQFNQINQRKSIQTFTMLFHHCHFILINC